jgi:ABC-type glycerol-3-phosphate transport system substrate-binding protein
MPSVRNAGTKIRNWEATRMTAQPLTRRALMTTTGAAAAATLAAPFVRTAGAAGSLRVGYWDHWVPGANTAMTQICEEWAEKEKVNLTIDYLSTQGNKLYLTIAAEALARAGHDIMDLSAWEPRPAPAGNRLAKSIARPSCRR